MQLTAQFFLDDPGTAQQRRFKKELGKVNAPAVPRVGEYVVIPAVGPFMSIVAKVVDVVHPLDGSVTLNFGTEWLSDRVAAGAQCDQLLTAGFEELAPGSIEPPNAPLSFGAAPTME